MGKKKIAIIAQRYGLEVNGGAELHARILAERLHKNYEVEVLTTTALDYVGWKNHYPAGNTVINGVGVIRFPTITCSQRQFRKAKRAVSGKKKYFKLLKFLRIYNFLKRKTDWLKITRKDVNNWFEKSGPYCPKMPDYIKIHKNEYDAFIFFTYLYYPTAVGMRLVPEKSIFIPTAHDESSMYIKPYETIFSVPKFIMYNTESERRLVKSKFANVALHDDIAGVGIEPHVFSEGYVLPEKFRFDFNYFIYIGRIERNKGCEKLIDYFECFSKEHPDIKLVMVGRNHLTEKEVDDRHILLTGFVSEDDKYALLQNSIALILPSEYESLSMVTLEAMVSEKQAVVNEKCDVLKQHVLKSGTGKLFSDYKTFKNSLEELMNADEQYLQEKNRRAKNYVLENYNWNTVLAKFGKALNFIAPKQNRL